MRAATIRQRPLEVLPSRSDYRRLSDYPARNGQRLLSDYSATIAEQIPHRSFSKLSKNFSKTRSEFFSKPFEKSSGFSARRVKGCRGRAVSAGGQLGRLGGGRQPPGRRDLPSAAIMRTPAGTGSGPDASRAAQGLGGTSQVIRGQRSGARWAAGLAVRRAAAAADAAVSLPLWSG